ncbi:MAG TPA: hypothetical protein VNY05_07475 [Candidatus Acidoferrales bacterium]|nr:hypothetical protein [Candidatus Acidoferrales bacterium]
MRRAGPKRGALAIAIVSALSFPGGVRAAGPASGRGTVSKIVEQIQRADYEGDRSALQRLYEGLAPFNDDKELGFQVCYWRGFALWRRALNGFNESAGRAGLEHDLQSAVKEFEASSRRNPAFVEPKIAALSCISSLLFLTQNDASRVHDLLVKGLPLLREAQAAEPENPRLLWVLGARAWYNPPERGGGEAIALETYQKGLLAARQHKAAANEPLVPNWGEPELLMNLAWSNLHRQEPDLHSAEQYALQALALVPYWHYVRDILLPQIQDAKRKRRHE